jgi:16S rRNA G527 N7-methylase RsmG
VGLDAGSAAAAAKVFDRARRAGFLGSVSNAELIEHSEAFLSAVSDLGPDTSVVELGSGAGVPGLVMALRRPAWRFRLIERSERRADHLRRAGRELGLDRVVVDQRAVESVGRDPVVRGSADVVVARAFAPPAPTAECAAPLLSAHGLLVVSEPPACPETVPDADRWAGLAGTDLPLRFVRFSVDGPRLALLERTGSCPDRYPRSVDVPRRRPLFE